MAIVKMDGIPSSGIEQPADLLKDSEIIKDYSGELKLDLTAGKINNYLENLQQKWTVAFPTDKEDASKGPAVLTMSETHLYHIEEVD